MFLQAQLSAAQKRLLNRSITSRAGPGRRHLRLRCRPTAGCRKKLRVSISPRQIFTRSSYSLQPDLVITLDE